MNHAASSQRYEIERSQNRFEGVQRWAPLIGGGALALFGLSRRSKSGVAVAGAGALLAYYGSKSASLPGDFDAEASVIVNAPVEKVYQFWHRFDDFPLFMRHLESVTTLGDRRSKWVALGPLGTRVEWIAEITNERPNESLSWSSLSGSDIDVDGAVRFSNAIGNRGTLIEARVKYRVPAGSVGASFAKLLGKDPSFLMEQDLRRLKALMETGEIPTTEGQSHGPRDTLTGVARILDPDQGIARDIPRRDVLKEKRRAS
jgi:uncharacterized membrane protein